MNKQPQHLYEFGPFRVNVTERILFKGDEILPIRAKVFDMLLVLIENNGHLVEKEFLMRTLWPDTFVEESSLVQSISVLRKLLGEGESGQQYIRTIPKRGYRFVADVRENHDGEMAARQDHQGEVTPHSFINSEPLMITEVVEAAPSGWPTSSGIHHRTGASRSTRRWKTYALLTGILIVVAVSLAYWRRSRAEREKQLLNLIPKSIGVLPFRTLGVENKEDLTGLGMADALIHKLSKVDHLTILPTSTIAKYTNDSEDAFAIGRSLGVEAILEGTVQRADDSVRVTAQLIRLSDGRILWAGKFYERSGNIFNVQDSISEQLSAALAIHIASGHPERIAKRQTQNTEAYEAYLLGLYFWNQSGKDAVTKAITYFERAVEQDPEFAIAYTYLADSYYFSAAAGYGLVPYEEALKRSRSNVIKALSLDNAIAEAHTVLAGLKSLEKDYAGAELEHKRALELNPNFAIGHNRYGVFLFNRSDLNGAVRELRQGQQLDPVSRLTNVALANMLLFARKYEETVKYASRALEIDPQYPRAHLVLGEGYLLQSNYVEAIKQFEEMSKLQHDQWYPAGRIDLVIAYALSGRKPEAQRLLQELLSSEEQPLPYHYATAYAFLGDKDKALEWLSKEKLTPFRLATLRFDPFLDPLRSEPGFTELLQKPVQDD